MGSLRVFAAEREVGLEDQLAKSVARVSAPLRVSASRPDFERFIEGLKKLHGSVQTPDELAALLAQPDLAYLTSVLVSTGWNLNDDVFTPEETWPARQTPVHKPINIEHQEDVIIGHIVESQAVDKEGKELVVAEGQSPPEEFDIEVAGVLYKSLPALADRVEAILERAAKGELFVSMEVWFDDFGYGFQDPQTGATRIVARDEQTAFLTRHLRAYGGTGEYEGYRIGRVLRHLVFAGKGIVEHPANPESVIKEVAKVAASQITGAPENSEGGAGSMASEKKEETKAEDVQAKLDATAKALEAKTAAHTAVVAELETLKAKKLDEQVAALTAEATEFEKTLADATAAGAELQKNLAKATKRADAAEAELVSVRKAEKARERLAKLSAVKKIGDEKAALAELAEMSDETFAVVLKYAGEAKTAGAPAGTAPKQTPKPAEGTPEVKPEEATAALATVQPEPEADLQGGAGKTGASLLTAAKATAACLLGRKNKTAE
jgi:hypothetical protein